MIAISSEDSYIYVQTYNPQPVLGNRSFRWAKGEICTIIGKEIYGNTWHKFPRAFILDVSTTWPRGLREGKKRYENTIE